MATHQKTSWFDKSLVFIAWTLIIAGIIAGVRYYLFKKRNITTNNAQVDQYITPVASKVSGFIAEVHFEDHQFVNKGDTLVILDNMEFENQLSVIEAEVEEEEDNISAHVKSAQTTQSTIEIQKAKIEAAEIQVWKTEQDYHRFKNLLQENAATQQQFEQMKAAYDAAKVQLQTARKELKTAQLSTLEQKAKIAPNQSNRKQKNALRNNAKLYLSYHIVTAPYDGWVSRKNIQVGQLVKAGQTLVNIVSKEKWITANFKETQIAPLKIGGKVSIVADAYPNIEFFGSITSFSPATGSRFSLLPLDNSTGNFVKIEQRIPVKIAIDDNQNLELLKAGMNVIVHAQNENN